MPQLVFDEETGKQLEALYRIADAVRRRRLVRGALRATPGERILDVGCGPGFYCAELVEEVGPGGAIMGLDSSPHMLALAASRCERHANVDFAEADATSLPVKHSSFDAALCVQMLEYLPDVSAGLAELYRALRPGGRVVVWDVDWATLSWHSTDPDRMQRVLNAWDKHLVHRSLPRTLAPAMRAAGFDHVEMEPHSFATAVFTPTPTAPRTSLSSAASWQAGTQSPQTRRRSGRMSNESSVSGASSTSPASSSASRASGQAEQSQPLAQRWRSTGGQTVRLEHEHTADRVEPQPCRITGGAKPLLERTGHHACSATEPPCHPQPAVSAALPRERAPQSSQSALPQRTAATQSPARLSATALSGTGHRVRMAAPGAGVR